nr:putative deoxyribonuclease RhsA [Paraburkholderia busanensis]
MATLTDPSVARICSGTPVLQVFDNRGLDVRALQYNRIQPTDTDVDELITRETWSEQGHLLTHVDPRLFATSAAKPNFSYWNSLSGRVLNTESADAGVDTMVYDVEGRAAWWQDGRGTQRRQDYDPLGRPVTRYETQQGCAERASERLIYGDSESDTGIDPGDMNCRGQLIRHYDTAGLRERLSYSLQGLAFQSSQQLLADPEGVSDWQDADEACWQASLENTAYMTTWAYDAVGAMLTQTDARNNLQRRSYDIAGQLAGTYLTLANGDEQPALKTVDYDATGRKLQEVAGNGVVTAYGYETRTQRLIALKTTRAAQDGRQTVLQNLNYDYDPVGNILSIADLSQPTLYFRNQQVDAISAYSYDALYQLLSATGRENAGAAAQTLDLPAAQYPAPDNPLAMDSYARRYTYDRGGNLTKIQHSGASASYSLEMQVSATSNHALQQTGSSYLMAGDVEGSFDACGNLVQVTPGGQPLAWDSRNQLQHVMIVTRSDGNDDDRESYQYDGGGMRTRKYGNYLVSSNDGSRRIEQVIYLPGLEVRMSQSGSVIEQLDLITVGETGRCQVRVLHWSAGKPEAMINDEFRYSLDNHLGSSRMELTDDASVLTYEEYYPYGGTAVWAGKNDSEVKYKYRRYSGKERDTTGLYYYGYRYYAPWLGRWINPDPAGTIDGSNLYRMVKNNPVKSTDSHGLADDDDDLYFVGYHGTTENSASSIIEKGIDISKLPGRGQIGRGFYVAHRPDNLPLWAAGIQGDINYGKLSWIKRAANAVGLVPAEVKPAVLKIYAKRLPSSSFKWSIMNPPDLASTSLIRADRRFVGDDGKMRMSPDQIAREEAREQAEYVGRLQGVVLNDAVRYLIAKRDDGAVERPEFFRSRSFPLTDELEGPYPPVLSGGDDLSRRISKKMVAWDAKKELREELKLQVHFKSGGWLEARARLDALSSPISSRNREIARKHGATSEAHF